MDTWENRVLIALEPGRLSFYQLKHKIEKDIGYMDAELLHYELKKLKSKYKITTVPVGETIFYQKIV